MLLKIYKCIFFKIETRTVNERYCFGLYRRWSNSIEAIKTNALFLFVLGSPGGIIYHHGYEILRVLAKEKVEDILQEEESTGPASRLSDTDIMVLGDKLQSVFFIKYIYKIKVTIETYSS